MIYLVADCTPQSSLDRMIKESFSVCSKTLRHCDAVGAVSCNGSVGVKLITSPLALLILTLACLNSTVSGFNIL